MGTCTPFDKSISYHLSDTLVLSGIIDDVMRNMVLDTHQSATWHDPRRKYMLERVISLS